MEFGVRVSGLRVSGLGLGVWGLGLGLRVWGLGFRARVQCSLKLVMAISIF